MRRSPSVNLRLVLGLAILALLAAAAAGAGIVQQMLGHDPFAPDLFQRYGEASADHPLGTDELGRDILLRLLHGGRVSLAVGLGVALGATLLGTGIGLLAAWRGGWMEAVLMRLADGLLALPALPLLVVLAAVDTGRFGLPRGEAVADIARITLILMLFGWVGVARLARAAALTQLSLDYVAAARVSGATEARVLLRHVLPNIASPIAVATALAVAGAVLAESTLSFLGLGIQPPAPSWGNMLANAQEMIFAAPWTAFWPGLAILLTVTACSLVADGIRLRR
ncbi:ABC transporter permease [Siccirubricoccus sp. KC 17139]|uniref:ABC transporter permease n=1 Tax=Siccirubricoccus soli TaxID=2899147 RepID=A0ABT1CZ70_9PROT|nr:ABC transporter permease [Siccirubricoccus soli]MCO6414971.1 ABC transporter permease [Siccirubricoccus soli]MCP2681102.1 ABC transporter permease [Siccirubricoccus soli]